MNNYYTLMYTRNWNERISNEISQKRDIIVEIIPDQNSAK